MCCQWKHLEEPNKGLYITWVDDDDMVKGIDYPREWSSGTTAIHLACQQGATEIYLMGFDLVTNPLNNVYERTKMSIRNKLLIFLIDLTGQGIENCIH